MHHLLKAFVFTCVLSLAACGQDNLAEAPAPKEPGPYAIGFFCHMKLTEHVGPKGQIMLKDWTEPLWFSSVRDALTYIDQDLVNEEQLIAFWVNDMERGSWDKPAPGSWIDAKSAWYVIGSRKASSMGDSEAVPFKQRDAASRFASEHGGRVVDYLTARQVMNEMPPTTQEEEKGT